MTERRDALRVSVVGHVNTGKTSLIAALSRRSDLAVGDGRTTLDIQEVHFNSGGEHLLCLVDTPGFEMLSEITEELEGDRSAALDAGTRRDDLDLLEAFLRTARAAGRPELELDLRALEAALAADVIFYVVDATQEPLERLRDELALLVRTARPVVGVLNFTAEASANTDAWHEVFRREKVHAVVAYDVMVRDESAEAELFRTMLTVVPASRRDAVSRLERAQADAALRHRLAAIPIAAELLLDCMTAQVTVQRAGATNPETEARRRLEEQVVERERRGFAALGRAHGFTGDEVGAPASAGAAAAGGTPVLFDEGLFDLATMRRYAPSVLSLTAGGAAAGGAIDLMVGGASMFAGALIGGAAGLVGGLLRRVSEVHERGDAIVARLHPDLAWPLLARTLACNEAYRRRTHARRDVEQLDAPSLDLQSHADLAALPGAAKAVELLRAAQDDPRLTGAKVPSPRHRAERLVELERELARTLP